MMMAITASLNASSLSFFHTVALSYLHRSEFHKKFAGDGLFPCRERNAYVPLFP